MPAALTLAEQKEYAVKMQEHLAVVMNAPCAYFEGHPFLTAAANKDGGGVYIKAVIERFVYDKYHADEAAAAAATDVQDILVERFNHLFQMGTNVSSHFHYKLKATKLKRCEGGFQFEAKKEPEFFIRDCLRASPVSGLWAKYAGSSSSYKAFTDDCQIRFTQNQPFGNTSARIITFSARGGVPLYIMLWLFRELSWPQSPSRQWMGHVEVIETNGLPDGQDWLCWYSSLITWFENEHVLLPGMRSS